MDTGRTRLESVQILRGCAAMAVVCEHASWLVGRSLPVPEGALLERLGSLPELLSAGVDLFFVISGFVMAFSARRFAGGPGSGRFLLQRFVRIAPLLYLVTLVVCVQSWRGGYRISPHVLLDSLLIAPFFDGAALPLQWPVVYFGWSLAYEFVFYVLVAATIVLRQTERALVLLAILGALPLLGLAIDPAPAAVRLATNWMVWEFALGVLAYVLWQRGWLARHARAVRTSAIAAAVVLLAQLHWGFLDANQPPLYEAVDPWQGLRRVLLWGLPCLFVFCWALGVDFRRFRRLHPPLLLLGNASYSIYLVQVLVYGPVIKMAVLVGISAGVTVLLLLVACPVAGILCYFSFERPVTGALQRWLQPRPIAGQLVAQTADS